jgi:hypothetical protein
MDSCIEVMGDLDGESVFNLTRWRHGDPHGEPGHFFPGIREPAVDRQAFHEAVNLMRMHHCRRPGSGCDASQGLARKPLVLTKEAH